MVVLLTGAAGFVGRHVATLLDGLGHEVIGVGRRAAAAGRGPGSQTDYRAHALADEVAVGRVVREVRPERVLHLAADASVAASWGDPKGTLDRNLAGAHAVLAAVREHAPEAGVLLACSGEEYGAVPLERLPIGEEEPLRPQNPYAVSKAAIDLLGGFFADAHGLRVLRARAFNHAGPGQSDAYVVSSFARQVAEAEARTEAGAEPGTVLTGNLDARRDVTDVRDVARAYWTALEAGLTGPVNVCSERAPRVADLLAGLLENAGTRVAHRADPARSRPSEVAEVRGSARRLTEATGWRPEIPLERTLADTLDWWRERVAATPERVSA